MDIRTLNSDFYKKIVEEKSQSLQKEMLQKDRGYGIVSITINELIYAVPLRSNLSHNFGYKTIFLRDRKIWCGLDYTKALIVNSEDISSIPFKLKNESEFKKIQNNKEKIIRGFEKYVVDYIKLVQTGGELRLRYKFTTLQYYHRELGLLTIK